MNFSDGSIIKRFNEIKSNLYQLKIHFLTQFNGMALLHILNLQDN